MLYETILDGGALSLLEEYCSLPFLKNFSLAGGTGLALRLGHRLSYDLDLFSYEKFDVSLLDTQLDSYYGNTYIKRGNLSNALFSTVNSIKSDFVYDYGKRIKETDTYCAVRMYAIEENIAMKMNAICGRGRKRNFYDLYFILQKFSMKEVFDFFTEKFGDEKLILLYKSITYFDDAENDETPVLLREKITWSQVKKSILRSAKSNKL